VTAITPRSSLAADSSDRPASAIKVLIVDDHAVVREGLRSLLEMFGDIEVVGEAVNGLDALEVLGQLAADSLPDVAIVDMRMPELDGTATIARMAAQYPSVAVLVLTSYDDGHSVRGAISAGCRGYLLKDASPDELVSAVRRTRSGDMPIDPAVTAVLARPFKEDRRAIDTLTPREREIAALLTRGLSNREIAKQLIISERTARTHVCNILAKLGFTSRTQVALWASEAQLS
jgi:DNA-binding NarL/FixJ family response regulator